MAIYSHEAVAIIVAYRDSLLELELTEYGDVRLAIQFEIAECRKYIKNAMRYLSKDKYRDDDEILIVDPGVI